MSPVNVIDKKAVAESFSKAAYTYDAVADFQRLVANRLFDYLPEKIAMDTVLDLGCGTGYCLEKLLNKSKPENLLALDIAYGMLNYARVKECFSTVQWCCGDAENLPFTDNCFTFIMSNLSIQWCNNLQRLFAEIYRVLKPEGCFLFSSLGPETLKELRQSWCSIDAYPHVNEFDHWDTHSEAIAQAELSTVLFKRKVKSIDYASVNDLAGELKELGAHNNACDRFNGLTGKSMYQNLQRAYEIYRQKNGKLPVTYEVFYALVRKVDGNSYE